jgi:hypothetical protein
MIKSTDKSFQNLSRAVSVFVDCGRGKSWIPMISTDYPLEIVPDQRVTNDFILTEQVGETRLVHILTMFSSHNIFCQMNRQHLWRQPQTVAM